MSVGGGGGEPQYFYEMMLKDKAELKGQLKEAQR